MNTSTLIILIVSIALLIIIAIIIYLCTRKKKPVQTDIKKEELVEIKIQQDLNNPSTPQLKQFIKIEEKANEVRESKENKDSKDNKDSVSYSMSTTDRKLLNQNGESAFSSRVDINLKDSIDSLGIVKQENEKTRRISNLEASFRTDLCHLDTKTDKLKEFIEVSKNKNPEIYQENVFHGEEITTSKDIIADNIINYTEGNRADFYSEAGDDNVDDIDIDDEIEMKYNFYDIESGGNIREVINPDDKRTRVVSFGKEEDFQNHQHIDNTETINPFSSSDITTNLKRNSKGIQEMTSEEHGDFFFDDEDDQNEVFNKYSKPTNKLNN